MYGFLWRRFPGGLGGKLLCSTLLAAAVVLLLFVVVFPWVETLLPFQDVTVEGEPAAPQPSSGG